MKRLMTVGAASAMAITLAAAPAAQADPAPQPGPLAAIEAIPTATPDDLLGQLEAANAQLIDLGLTPFLWPTAAINCSQAPDAPLGIVPAVAGAIPGPGTPGGVDLDFSVPGLGAFDLSPVRKGEVLYGFFPAGIVNDSPDKSGLTVGWFNVNTFQGGFEPLGSVTSTILAPVEAEIAKLPAAVQTVLAAEVIAPLKAALEALPQAGARAGVVETGSGTVLSVILGSVTHSGGTCYFLPTVGIQEVA